MSKKPKNLSSDLRGIGKITIDAVKGTTSVVESLHSTISQYTSILGDPKEKTKGLTGMVYKSINSVTHLLGEGIDAIFSKTSQLHGDYSSSHEIFKTREAVASAMNGVLGDHFENSNNPLAILMSFRLNGHSLELEQLNELVANAQNTVTILIHGLCMNDLQWSRKGHNHGEFLSKDLNHTVIYLHYNTGLHVSENGRELAQLLNEIIITNKTSLNFVCHSMGGLVARSACYYAKQAKHKWLSRLQKMIFLGTPHHGAILAKGSHWADVLLQISPYSAPFAKITKVRSSGLTDLHHGYIIDEDWKNNERQSVSLPENVSCYAIATTTLETQSSKINDKIVGDGLVTVNSALGKHEKLNLNIPESNLWTKNNINHMQLLSDHKVYGVIKNWLKI